MSNAVLETSKIKLFTLPQPHACSYLPGRLANSVFLDPRETPSSKEYSALTHLGFRRSGAHYYRPHCPGCDACISCRVLCQSFEPNRKQRRIQRKNFDIQVEIKPVSDQDEYYSLYQSYIASRHPDGDMHPASRDQYESFILAAPSNSFLIEHRVDNQLLAIALTDELEDGWSAIYTFFDPRFQQRSLGVWSVLSQIQMLQGLQKPYLYLGYWIKGCRKMEYKNEYLPQEYFTGQEWVSNL